MPEAIVRGDMKLRQYMRVEGAIEHPLDVVVKSVQVRLLDSRGAERANQLLRL
jgi:single-stranded DNA-binding protein